MSGFDPKKSKYFEKNLGMIISTFSDQKIDDIQEYHGVIERRENNVVFIQEKFKQFSKEYREYVFLMMISHNREGTFFSRIPNEVIINVLIPFIDELDVFKNFNCIIGSYYRTKRMKKLVSYELSDSRKYYVKKIEKSKPPITLEDVEILEYLRRSRYPVDFTEEEKTKICHSVLELVIPRIPRNRVEILAIKRILSIFSKTNILSTTSDYDDKGKRVKELIVRKIVPFYLALIPHERSEEEDGMIEMLRTILYNVPFTHFISIHTEIESMFINHLEENILAKPVDWKMIQILRMMSFIQMKLTFDKDSQIKFFSILSTFFLVLTKISELNVSKVSETAKKSLRKKSIRDEGRGKKTDESFEPMCKPFEEGRSLYSFFEKVSAVWSFHDILRGFHQVSESLTSYLKQIFEAYRSGSSNIPFFTIPILHSIMTNEKVNDNEKVLFIRGGGEDDDDKNKISLNLLQLSLFCFREIDDGAKRLEEASSMMEEKYVEQKLQAYSRILEGIKCCVERNKHRSTTIDQRDLFMEGMLEFVTQDAMTISWYYDAHTTSDLALEIKRTHFFPILEEVLLQFSKHPYIFLLFPFDDSKSIQSHEDKKNKVEEEEMEGEEEEEIGKSVETKYASIFHFMVHTLETSRKDDDDNEMYAEVVLKMKESIESYFGRIEKEGLDYEKLKIVVKGLPKEKVNPETFLARVKRVLQIRTEFKDIITTIADLEIDSENIEGHKKKIEEISKSEVEIMGNRRTEIIESVVFMRKVVNEGGPDLRDGIREGQGGVFLSSLLSLLPAHPKDIDLIEYLLVEEIVFLIHTLYCPRSFLSSGDDSNDISNEFLVHFITKIEEYCLLDLKSEVCLFDILSSYLDEQKMDVFLKHDSFGILIRFLNSLNLKEILIKQESVQSSLGMLFKIYQHNVENETKVDDSFHSEFIDCLSHVWEGSMTHDSKTKPQIFEILKEISGHPKGLVRLMSSLKVWGRMVHYFGLLCVVSSPPDPPIREIMSNVFKNLPPENLRAMLLREPKIWEGLYGGGSLGHISWLLEWIETLLSRNQEISDPNARIIMENDGVLKLYIFERVRDVALQSSVICRREGGDDILKKCFGIFDVILEQKYVGPDFYSILIPIYDLAIVKVLFGKVLDAFRDVYSEDKEYLSIKRCVDVYNQKVAESLSSRLQKQQQPTGRRRKIRVNRSGTRKKLKIKRRVFKE